MAFKNVYEDDRRAEAYARLKFPGTYYLAYRDLPEIIAGHVDGTRALDFGCGTGRSTRFLKGLGFDVVGVDISENMVSRAREADPGGDYRTIEPGLPGEVDIEAVDLVLAAFTFDNIPTPEDKLQNLQGLGSLLGEGGKLMLLVSSPEIYTHEWASFSTKDFPENTRAKSGDVVRIVQTDIDDKRPVEDVLCSDEDYKEAFARAGLEVVATYRPLARDDEPFEWVNETRIPPWVIYVLKGTE